jgi:hypothetical protein
MRLFKALGRPLVTLEKYLEHKEYIAINPTQLNALNLPLRIGRDLEPMIGHKINHAINISKNTMSKQSLEIKNFGNQFLNKIIDLDKKSEISLISTYMAKSLIMPSQKKQLELSYELGAANIFAWIAYTIYDDFIDGEGNPSLLSLANIMHRESYSAYTALFPEMNIFINDYFNSVDNSNLWELQNCRAKILNENITIDKIPIYDDGKFLAERSIGHVLGPMLLIKKQRVSKDQENLICESLNHYLIAKQINDDISDWKSDTRNGHLNFVVSKLLISANIKKGDYNVNKLINKLDKHFWNSTLKECLLMTISNLENSEEKLKKSGLFQTQNIFLDNIINPLKYEVENILKHHQGDKDFLKAYIS